MKWPGFGVAKLTKAAVVTSLPYSFCLILYNVIMYRRSSGTIMAFDAIGLAAMFVFFYLLSFAAILLTLGRALYLHHSARKYLGQRDALVFVFLLSQILLPVIVFSFDP